eukprot:2472969-Pyramimonas_sp.AAC.1
MSISVDRVDLRLHRSTRVDLSRVEIWKRRWVSAQITNVRIRRAKVDRIMGCWYEEDAQVFRPCICSLPGAETRPPRAARATSRRARTCTGWWSTDR